jgi:heme oxygenase
LANDLGLSKVKKTDISSPNSAWSWGVLYALNGSSLGASVLLKKGAIDAAWPRQYLEEMRRFAKSGMLKSFFDELNAAPFKVEDMATGANDVFNLLASK